MATLSTYIEYALMTRHYCYVPGLGAFMSNEVPGLVRQGEDGVMLVAPHREVALSTAMRRDDGQLTLLVMQSRGISYDQAAAYLRQEVTALQGSLSHGGTVSLGSLGSLTLDGGEVRFVPSDRARTPQDCGLENFLMPTWRDVERQRYRIVQPAAATVTAPAASAAPAAVSAPGIHTDARNIHISLPRAWVRSAAIVLLVVSSFFVSPVPTGIGDGGSQYASMLSGDAAPIHLNTLPTQSWEDAWEDEAFYQAETAVPAEASEAPVPADSDPAVAETAEATASSVPAAALWTERQPAGLPDSEALFAQSANGKIYYIIVASRSSRQLAEEGLARLEQEGYGPIGILERDGKFRLYINIFALKPEAEAYLETLRQQEGFADAWLLPIRQTTLSHHNKTTYNDNYLSMELSHPKPRTDSRQG